MSKLVNAIANQKSKILNPIGKSVNRSIGPSVNPIINPKSKIENTQSVNRTIGKSVNPSSPSPHPIPITLPMHEYIYYSQCPYVSTRRAIGTSGGFEESFFIGIHREVRHAN